MLTKPFKIPTRKEFRDDPRTKGTSWFDVYGSSACETCGKAFQPGEIIYSAGYKKGYHKKCIPEDIDEQRG